MANYFDSEKIFTASENTTATIRISERQRTLCQQVALLALRLVCTKNCLEQEKLRQEMLAAVDLMAISHQGLISGNADMKLPGQPSPAIQKMYFDAPLYLDQKIRDYMAEVRALAQAHSTELTQENEHLQNILKESTTELLNAMEAVVSQYQKESDTQQLTLEMQLAKLYQQSCTNCTAAAVAKAHAQQLEFTLRDLQRTQAQLVQTEKLSSIGQMVAGIAHEINNPVNFISSNLCYASDYVQNLLDLLNLYQESYPSPLPAIQIKAQAIELDFLLEDLPKVLSSMQVGADRIRQIVLSLRNFSRSDCHSRQWVNLHEGIDSTLLILQHRLKAQSDRPTIELVKEYGTLPEVECYAGQLNQVFMNILSNAIDAIESRLNYGNRITIRTRLNDDSSGVIIQIADNGPGMTPEVKTQLFNPFFTTKPRGKGTGLGLSISHQIVVEKHGGILKCESVLEQGTEFWIELPLQPPQDRLERQSKVMALNTNFL